MLTTRDLAPVFGDQPALILREIRRASDVQSLRSLNRRARAEPEQRESQQVHAAGPDEHDLLIAGPLHGEAGEQCHEHAADTTGGGAETDHRPGTFRGNMSVALVNRLADQAWWQAVASVMKATQAAKLSA